MPEYGRSGSRRVVTLVRYRRRNNEPRILDWNVIYPLVLLEINALPDRTTASSASGAALIIVLIVVSLFIFLTPLGIIVLIESHPQAASVVMKPASSSLYE
jgi:hypothetical protein